MTATEVTHTQVSAAPAGPWDSHELEHCAEIFVDTRIQVCCGHRHGDECCGEPDIEGEFTSICQVAKPEYVPLLLAAPDLLEACQTFVEWLHRITQRDTPEGERAWRIWYDENLRICDLAQTQARAAIAKALAAARGGV